MDYLPLFFDLKNRPCLLVGGGDIALRKARLLVKAGARITVVAPEICEDLRDLVKANEGSLVQRPFQDTDVDQHIFVIGATDLSDINAQISHSAQAKNIPVNIVDSPELCTVITPAIVDRSPLVIAISSGGQAPVLARMARAKIETLFPASYSRLADLASRLRERVKQAFSDLEQRRYFWENIFESEASELALNGQVDEAESLIIEKLQASAQGETIVNSGEVYLVGAGPGDPDLLTFKALRLMQQCDVVLYDRLVSDGVMELVRRDADRIYVGKARSDHAVPQGQINELLVTLAQEGKRVLRLKGGDPFIFGRGGEEIETLAGHDIPFQVVPGITAASGCSASTTH